MKILVVHNFYQSSAPSGEDLVFTNETDLLRSRGVEVVTYERSNDELTWAGRNATTALETVWSSRTYREVKTLIDAEKPDIAHFHNIWYRISPAAYYACENGRVPVVQTVHNFRMLCVNGLLLRGGQTCEDCLGKNAWRGVLRGCFRLSRLHSFPVFATQTLHRWRGVWRDKIDHYIALTDFGQKKLGEGGLPLDRFSVKPNFLPDGPAPTWKYDDYAVFLGRLTEEKGINFLLDSWELIEQRLGKGFRLKVIGDGAMRVEIEERISGHGARDKKRKLESVDFSGHMSHGEAMKLLNNASFLVLPSLCYEMFPLTTIEAFSCGKPVVGTRTGAMQDIVTEKETGLLFEQGNSEDLARCLLLLIENRKYCQELGVKARAEFDTKFTADVNFTQLMDIYKKVALRRD